MTKWDKIQEELTNISKKAIVIIIILWIISTTLAIYGISQAQYVEEKVQVNKITEITNFDYETRNLPNGIKGFEGIIFPKYQKTITVSINSDVASDKPVKIEGNYTIILKLVAEGLWEHHIPLTEKHNFNFEGETNQIINKKIVIDLEKIYNDTEIIANEIIGLRPSRYLVKIEPIVEGNMIYDDHIIKMNTAPQITFEIGHSQVTLIEDQEKQFIKNTPIDEKRIIEKTINIWGAKIQIPIVKFVFSFISSLATVMLIVNLIYRRKRQKERITEADEIEKKYKNRLVPIQEQIEGTDKINIFLETFKSLVRIADEKDQGILKYHSNKENKTYYFVADGDYIYSYISCNRFSNKLEATSKI